MTTLPEIETALSEIEVALPEIEVHHLVIEIALLEIRDLFSCQNFDFQQDGIDFVTSNIQKFLGLALKYHTLIVKILP